MSQILVSFLVSSTPFTFSFSNSESHITSSITDGASLFRLDNWVAANAERQKAEWKKTERPERPQQGAEETVERKIAVKKIICDNKNHQVDPGKPLGAPGARPSSATAVSETTWTQETTG